MKNLPYTLSILCFLLSSSLYAQMGLFRIEGNIKGNHEGETVMIDVLKGGGFPQTYSSTVKDHAFLIEIDNCNSCDTLAKFRIGNNPEEIFLWLDEESIQVNSNNGKVRITGTKLNDQYQQYRDTIEYYYKELAPHFAETDGKTSITYDIHSKEYKLMRSLGRFEYDFIKENIRNPIGVYLFKAGILVRTISISMYRGDSAVIDMYNLADERIQSDPTAKKWKESAERGFYLRDQHTKRLHTKIADLDVLTIDGKKDMLLDIISESDSKYFILDFWASWCGPCIAAMPNLKDIYERYDKKGLEIIAISIDEDDSAWKKKLNQINMPWVNILFDKDKMSLNKLKEKYNFSAIPFSILVDKSGKIVSNLPTNKESLDKILDQQLSTK